MRVKFEIYKDGEFWCARGVGTDIVARGRTVDELMKNLRESIESHLREEPGPE